MARFLTSFFEADSAAHRIAAMLASHPLFPSQERALEHGAALRGTHFLYVAPTGSGKSFVAEAALARQLAAGRIVWFLTPTRALAREKAASLAARLGPGGYRVAHSSRDDRAADEDIRAGRVDVVVSVYEKGLSLYLQSPGLHAATGLLIADELQILADPLRGPMTQLLLLLWCAQKNAPQVIGLSSTAGFTPELVTTIGMERLEETERAIGFRKGRINLATGRATWKDECTGEEGGFTMPVRMEPEEDLADRIGEIVAPLEKPVLIFTPTRGQAASLARGLAESAAPASGLELNLAGDIGDDLTFFLQRRVGFHSAERTRAERAVVEELLRAGAIDVCVATATLAEGVNVSARTVLVIPADAAGGFHGKLENCLGRAGRPGNGPGAAFLLELPGSSPTEEWRPRSSPKSVNVQQLQLQSVAVILRAGAAADGESLRNFASRIPLLEGSALERTITHGAQCGFWTRGEDGGAALLPAGELLALGGCPWDALAGWRTMLRRFPDGGGAAANLFLALGGGGICDAVPISAEERAEARWSTELADFIRSDHSALARYFLDFLQDPARLPRSLHQSAKGVILCLRQRQGADLRALESNFRFPAGLLEDFLDSCAHTLWQFQRMTELQGHPIAIPPPAFHQARVVSAAIVEPAKIIEPLGPRLRIFRGKNGMVEFDGRKIALTRSQFSMLDVLARNAGEGVPYERITQQVWPDAKVEQQQIYYHRRNLEKKLLAEAGEEGSLIETQATWGLRLILSRDEVMIEKEVPAEAPLVLRSPPADYCEEDEAGMVSPFVGVY
ncbi:hypothetical protein BH09SUM1_BH09SUM1_30930 [soil metagenome]